MKRPRAARLGYLEIPGEATRRDYAVYVIVAQHRKTGEARLYVGKTGDNRVGCNPVISRVGNHFSFNKVHSQVRNKLSRNPADHNFKIFYTTFGGYVNPSESRERIDVINEMERRLNKLTQNAFGRMVINPYEERTKLRRWKRKERQALATPERMRQLEDMVDAVRKKMETGSAVNGYES